MAYTEKYANFDLATGANDGSSEADAWQTPAAVIAGVAAGNRVNIKRQATAYNLTATVTFNVSGTATAPIYYRAYTTTIGDGGIWECAYNSGGLCNLEFTGNYNIIEGIHFKPGATVNSHAFTISGSSSWLIRSKIQVSSGGISVANAYKCWFSVTSGSNHTCVMSNVNTASVIWKDCFIKRITGSSATRLLTNDNYDRVAILDNCIFKGIGTSGENGIFIDRADSQRGLIINNCIFYNFNSGIYIDEQANTNKEYAYITRCIFDTMSAYAIERNVASAGFTKLFGNFYKSCTSGFSNYADEDLLDLNTAFTVDPFNDKTNDDFTLNDTANAGAIIRAAEESMDPTNSSFMTIRALADFMSNAAAAGGLLVSPGMNGGLRG